MNNNNNVKNLINILTMTIIKIKTLIVFKIPFKKNKKLNKKIVILKMKWNMNKVKIIYNLININNNNNNFQKFRIKLLTN